MLEIPLSNLVVQDDSVVHSGARRYRSSQHEGDLGTRGEERSLDLLQVLPVFLHRHVFLGHGAKHI